MNPVATPRRNQVYARKAKKIEQSLLKLCRMFTDVLTLVITVIPTIAGGLLGSGITILAYRWRETGIYRSHLRKILLELKINQREEIGISEGSLFHCQYLSEFCLSSVFHRTPIKLSDKALKLMLAIQARTTATLKGKQEEFVLTMCELYDLKPILKERNGQPKMAVNDSVDNFVNHIKVESKNLLAEFSKIV